MMDEQDLVQALRAPWPIERRHRPGLDPSRPGYRWRAAPDEPDADRATAMGQPDVVPRAPDRSGHGRRSLAPRTTVLTARMVAAVAIVALAAGASVPRRRAGSVAGAQRRPDPAPRPAPEWLAARRDLCHRSVRPAG